jgi:hypothetical protein
MPAAACRGRPASGAQPTRACGHPRPQALFGTRRCGGEHDAGPSGATPATAAHRPESLPPAVDGRLGADRRRGPAGGVRRRKPSRAALEGRPAAREPEPSGQVADLSGQPADRRRHGTGAERHAQALQLGRLHLQEGRQGLREEVQAVRRQGADLDVQQHGRGPGQDPRRQGRLRRLLPDLRCAGQAGPGQVPAPYQPLLRRQHRSGLAGLPEPVLRPGLAVLGAVHRLHHRHRLAGRQGQRGHLQAAEPLRRLLGQPLQGQGRDPRRLPRGHEYGPAAQRGRRRQHRRPGQDQHGPRPARRHGQDDAAGGQHQRLRRPARGQGVGHPVLVGRHGQTRSTTCRKGRAPA